MTRLLAVGLALAMACGVLHAQEKVEPAAAPKAIRTVAILGIYASRYVPKQDTSPK